MSFLCQSYWFDENITWMKRGLSWRPILIADEVWGYFSPKTRVSLSLFFLSQVHRYSPAEGCSLCYAVALLKLLLFLVKVYPRRENTFMGVLCDFLLQSGAMCWASFKPPKWELTTDQWVLCKGHSTDCINKWSYFHCISSACADRVYLSGS